MYAGDNNDALVPNPGQDHPALTEPAWTRGDMSVPAEAIDRTMLELGLLWPYNKSYPIYKCPADRKDDQRGSDGSEHVHECFHERE